MGGGEGSEGGAVAVQGVGGSLIERGGAWN